MSDQPNLITIHTGTYDIQNKERLSSVKEYGTDISIKIALSSIIHRSDHNFDDKINETNRKLANL